MVWAIWYRIWRSRGQNFIKMLGVTQRKYQKITTRMVNSSQSVINACYKKKAERLECTVLKIEEIRTVEEIIGDKEKRRN